MVIKQPPTSYLPPIAKIAPYTSTQLLDALTYLKLLYNLEVRGSHRIHSNPRIVGDRLLPMSGGIESINNTQTESLLTFHGPVHPEILIQRAASLLAMCSGVSAAGTVERIFSFSSSEMERLDVRVMDVPIENWDYRNYTCGERPLRFLELSAGTGLVGLTVAKVLVASLAKRDCRATVVATDFYPSALDNLKANMEKYFPGDLTGGTVTITDPFLDWSKLPAMSSIAKPLSESFDVVFGADVVFEEDHAIWIKKCLERLLCRPSISAAFPFVATFHLVIPLRTTHLLETSSIGTASRDGDAKRGRDVVEYLYYTIGWSW
ncbi:hypothetical protein EDD16DRAFT_1883430 [Pisolithus croceorrhizus]|nr:hypothetical protein EV401DRAFT_2058975 [Pisolithus croceorrhizus]KAI6125587.1 hypothetical protein EDD16DRAFT_1883430 [Pisolithus croceorrhizus]